jgi:hypothetical protein
MWLCGCASYAQGVLATVDSAGGFGGFAREYLTFIREECPKNPIVVYGVAPARVLREDDPMQRGVSAGTGFSAMSREDVRDINLGLCWGTFAADIATAFVPVSLQGYAEWLYDARRDLQHRTAVAREEALRAAIGSGGDTAAGAAGGAAAGGGGGGGGGAGAGAGSTSAGDAAGRSDSSGDGDGSEVLPLPDPFFPQSPYMDAEQDSLSASVLAGVLDTSTLSWRLLADEDSSWRGGGGSGADHAAPSSFAGSGAEADDRRQRRGDRSGDAGVTDDRFVVQPGATLSTFSAALSAHIVHNVLAVSASWLWPPVSTLVSSDDSVLESALSGAGALCDVVSPQLVPLSWHCPVAGRLLPPCSMPTTGHTSLRGAAHTSAARAVAPHFLAINARYVRLHSWQQALLSAYVRRARSPYQLCAVASACPMLEDVPLLAPPHVTVLESSGALAPCVRYITRRFERHIWGRAGPLHSAALAAFRRGGVLGDEDFGDAREALYTLADTMAGE